MKGRHDAVEVEGPDAGRDGHVGGTLVVLPVGPHEGEVEHYGRRPHESDQRRRHDDEREATLIAPAGPEPAADQLHGVDPVALAS